ncbi:MAG: acyl-CoA dehydrogenase family protein [Acidimicrobiales bacterium]
MYLQETTEQRALRTTLREYFRGLMTPEVTRALRDDGESGPARRRVLRQMGADGMLGIGWPKEYGGQGRPATDQFIFFDEAQRAQAPLPFVTLNTVGPTLIEYGTDEQKQRFLPRILAGEIVFAIGYSEPSAGTDLASLTTRAVRDGDQWVINGQKIFTSGADGADYVWLACRTNPDVKKHQGISIIIVPTASPGFSSTPIKTVGNPTTTSTYYDEVRVPVGNLVGDENGGWKLITTQLNHERVGLAALSARAFELYDAVVAWAAATDSGEGGLMIDLPWVQTELATCRAKLQAMYLLNWRMTLDVGRGQLKPQTSSAVKVFGTEATADVYHRLLNILGPEAHMRSGSADAPIDGEVEAMGRTAQINTFGGGVNEVQREIVAWVGLGMTRVSR